MTRAGEERERVSKIERERERETGPWRAGKQPVLVMVLWYQPASQFRAGSGADSPVYTVYIYG